MTNSRDQSPIEINSKKARYGCPDHYDDSDVEDGTRFEDYPIAYLDIFVEQRILNQQDAPQKK